MSRHSNERNSSAPLRPRGRRRTGLILAILLAAAGVAGVVAYTSYRPWPGAREPLILSLAQPTPRMHWSLPLPSRREAAALTEKARSAEMSANAPARRDLLERATALDPSNAAAWAALGTTLRGGFGRTDLALVALSRALLLDPSGQREAAAAVVEGLGGLGRGEDAVQAGSWALRQFPGDPAIAGATAYAETLLRHWDEAEKILAVAAPPHPQDPSRQRL